MLTLLEKEKSANAKTATTTATKLYELLNIKQDSFIKEEDIGILHEKQMQAIYKDFKNSCTL